MKIAIDARFYGLENGGLGRYTINLVEQLQKLDKKNSYVLLLRAEWFQELKLADNFSKVLVKSRHYSVKEQVEVVRILNSVNPDITHFLHFNVPLFYRGKYIVTIHDLLMHQGVGREATTLSPFKYAVKRLGYRKVFDHAVKNALKVLVPSEFVKKEVLNTYSIPASSVLVIYEGVSDLKKGKTTQNQISNPYFLYAGNAYPHKNVKTLIQALKGLSENIKLVLVIPRDVFESRIQKEIKSADVENRVILKSNISDEQLYALYKNAVAFVYPSFSEGFGLQGLEAMNVGTLLLASNIPVFHEIYDGRANYFDPHNTKELTTKLEEVIKESKEERAEKIKKAKEFVSNYSWEKMTKDVLKIYKGI